GARLHPGLRAVSAGRGDPTTVHDLGRTLGGVSYAGRARARAGTRGADAAAGPQHATPLLPPDRALWVWGVLVLPWGITSCPRTPRAGDRPLRPPQGPLQRFPGHTTSWSRLPSCSGQRPVVAGLSRPSAPAKPGGSHLSPGPGSPL